jgi:hypothetical protein
MPRMRARSSISFLTISSASSIWRVGLSERGRGGGEGFACALSLALCAVVKVSSCWRPSFVLRGLSGLRLCFGWCVAEAPQRQSGAFQASARSPRVCALRASTASTKRASPPFLLPLHMHTSTAFRSSIPKTHTPVLLRSARPRLPQSRCPYQNHRRNVKRKGAGALSSSSPLSSGSPPPRAPGRKRGPRSIGTCATPGSTRPALRGLPSVSPKGGAKRCRWEEEVVVVLLLPPFNIFAPNPAPPALARIPPPAPFLRHGPRAPNARLSRPRAPSADRGGREPREMREKGGEGAVLPKPSPSRKRPHA